MTQPGTFRVPTARATRAAAVEAEVDIRSLPGAAGLLPVTSALPAFALVKVYALFNSERATICAPLLRYSVPVLRTALSWVKLSTVPTYRCFHSYCLSQMFSWVVGSDL